MLKIFSIKSFKYLILGLRTTHNPIAINKLEEYIKSNLKFSESRYQLPEYLINYHIVNHYAVFRSSNFYVDKFLDCDLLSEKCKLDINNKLYYCYKRS